MDAAESRRQVRLDRLLRKIRRERGVTQVQLAERLGLPQSAISKYENGERPLLFEEVVNVTEAVGMRQQTFFRRWLSPLEDFEDE